MKAMKLPTFKAVWISLWKPAHLSKECQCINSKRDSLSFFLLNIDALITLFKYLYYEGFFEEINDVKYNIDNLV